MALWVQCVRSSSRDSGSNSSEEMPDSNSNNTHLSPQVDIFIIIELDNVYKTYIEQFDLGIEGSHGQSAHCVLASGYR